MTSSFAYLRHWELQGKVAHTTRNRRGDMMALALDSGAAVLIPTNDSGEAPQVLSLEPIAAPLIAPDSDDHAFLAADRTGHLFLLEPGLAAPTSVYANSAPVYGLCTTPDGTRIYAAENALHCLDSEGKPNGKPLDVDSAVRTLATDAQGERLVYVSETKLYAVKGASVLSMPLSGPARALVLTETDLFFLLLATGQVEAWRIHPDGLERTSAQAMPGPLKSPFGALAFTFDQSFLVVAGGQQAVCWALGPDFAFRDREPLLLGEPGSRVVTAIAPNPYEPVVALGYDDGSLCLAPLDGRREILLLSPRRAPVVGLAWNKDGDSFLAAHEDGQVFLFTHKSISNYVRSGLD